MTNHDERLPELVGRSLCDAVLAVFATAGLDPLGQRQALAYAVALITVNCGMDPDMMARDMNATLHNVARLAASGAWADSYH